MHHFYSVRRTLLDPLAWYLSKREIHRLLQFREVEQIVEATQSYTGRGFYASIKPKQIREEFEALVQIVRNKNPGAVLEIGTLKGGTLFAWCRAIPNLRKIVSIDLPQGLYGGGYHEKRGKLYREFIADKPGVQMFLIRDDSHKQSTQEQVIGALKGVPLEFLFIDGDHRYEGVKRDFELYEPLVAAGGLIAFHDILPHKYHPECGVDRFWEEVKNDYHYYEIIRDRNQGRMGIGVLVKPTV